MALAIGAVHAPRARAQTGDAAPGSHDAEARAVFEAGRIAFADGRFADAVEHFRRAYALSGRPGLLYNIGQTEDRLRHEAAALEAFEAYLTAVADAPNRREVEARVALLREVVAAERAETEARERELRAREEAVRAEATRQAEAREEAVRDEAARQLAAQESALRAEAARREAEARAALEAAERRLAAARAEALEAAERAEAATVQTTIRTSEGEDAASAPVVDPLAVPAEAPRQSGGVETEWWFWTLLGAAVAGGAAAGVVYATTSVAYGPYREGENGVAITLTGVLP